MLAPAPQDDAGRPALDPQTVFADLKGATAIVLAVSGGPDSTAMMHLAARWRAETAAPPITVASVDHGLRPGARDDADRVAARARALGFAARTLLWEGEKPRRAIQERARAARYALLADHAAAIGASHLATAHTLDDQAETLLFRLARGSGLTGLAGMRPLARRGALCHARPLLGVRKADLVALCERNGWPFLDDPANANLAFARTRWRALAPHLAAEGLTPERLGQLAHRLARAEAALAAGADRLARTATLGDDETLRRFQGGLLATGPDELVLRVIGEALQSFGIQRPIRLQRLEALADEVLRHVRAMAPMGRTLHGCRVTLDAAGILTIAPERPRRSAQIGAAATAR